MDFLRVLDEQTSALNEAQSFLENAGDILKDGIMDMERLLENIYDNNVFAFGDIIYLLNYKGQDTVLKLDTINPKNCPGLLIDNKHDGQQMSQIYYYPPKPSFKSVIVTNKKLKLSGSGYFFFGFIDSELLNTKPEYMANYFIIDSEKGDYVKIHGKYKGYTMQAPDLKVSQNEVKLSGLVNFTLKFPID